MVESVLIYGEGFVGRSLYNSLKEEGKNVILRRLETGSCLSLERTFLQKNNVNVIINATGGSSVGASVADPLKDFNSNVQTVMYLIYLLENNTTKIKLIHFSSAAVYGDQADKVRRMLLSPYARHKILAEELLISSMVSNQLCILRPFSIYGVGMTKQVVWDSFNKLMTTDKEVEFYGTGFERRSFINIIDVVSMVKVVLSKGLSGCYDLHGDNEFSIRELVVMVSDIVGYKGVISFNGVVDDMSPSKLSSAVCALEMNGSQLVTLRTGLIEIFRWKVNQ